MAHIIHRAPSSQWSVIPREYPDYDNYTVGRIRAEGLEAWSLTTDQLNDLREEAPYPIVEAYPKGMLPR